jgi:ribosomal protein S18 acetylase RimI-like enzyme
LTAVTVEEATDLTPALLEALGHLVPQLSQSAAPIGETELAEMVASPATRLLVARLARAAGSGDTARAAGSGGPGGPIVGTLTLVLFRIPTGVRGWIEDVIVDETARGLGVGEALTAEAVRLAYDAGARTLDLTSRPSRQAAHRLYSKLGFEVRDTSVYRHKQQR